jgi:hypothetical protein
LMVTHIVFGLFFALTTVCAVRGMWLLATQWTRSRKREAVPAIAGPPSLSTPSPTAAFAREA